VKLTATYCEIELAAKSQRPIPEMISISLALVG